VTTHFGIMILFAACVGVVFGMLYRDAPRDQFQLAARIFIGLVLGAYAIGWLMYLGFG
jgi:Na+/H+-dicarboxylate symporter